MTLPVGRVAAGMVLALLLGGVGRAAGPAPAPPYPAPGRPSTPPPGYSRPPAPPPVPRVAPPPPLSPPMRVLYAPFYAAGLVVRYGFYYVIVAPIEVFSRALTYGAEGGVAEPQRKGDAP